MKNIFTAALILGAYPMSVHANQPITLQDGEYMGRGDYCRVLISNDSVHQTLLFEQVGTGTASCNVDGLTWEFNRVSETEFTYMDPKVEIIDQDTVSQCTPTSSEPMPCQSFLYDQSGSLIAKAGDQWSHSVTITLKNNDSFEQGTLQMVLMRGNTVVSHGDDPKGSPIMLYVKVSQ
jgi:hypothetical protein